MLGKYKLHWTEHSKLKMRQYGLSKSKLMNLLYRPERKEQGIVEGTMAVMQPNKIYSTSKPFRPGLMQAKRVPGEIWLMYKDVKQERKIISAWRYPGISKPGDSIPVPRDILEFIHTLN